MKPLRDDLLTMAIHFLEENAQLPGGEADILIVDRIHRRCPTPQDLKVVEDFAELEEEGERIRAAN